MNVLRILRGAVLFVALGPALAFGQTAGWPAKPLRILVGYAPGGPLDSISRALAPKLSEDLKQPVVVENRPGASGVIATEMVARAAPDGYTLILNGITHAILPALNPKLPFDTVKDFTAVGIVGYGPLVLVVNPALPVNSIAQLIALTKDPSRKISYASAGTGTSPHIAMEMLKRAAKIDMTHVPYKGSAPAIADVIAGHAQLDFDITPAALPHVRSGKLRAIAVSGQKRLPDLPDVPTITEAGYPEADLATWWGIFGPAGLPRPILERLSLALQKAVGEPEVRARFAVLGGDPTWTTPERFDEILRSDIARFTTIVKEARIRVD